MIVDDVLPLALGSVWKQFRLRASWNSFSIFLGSLPLQFTSFPPKVTTNLTIGSRKKHITCILFLHRHLKATRSPHLLIIFSHYFHHNFWMHLLPPPLAATSVATSTAGEPPSPQRRRAINGVMVWPNWLFQQLLSRVSWSVKDAFQESVWNMSEIIMVFLQRANNLERCTRGSIVTSSCSKT